MSVKLLEAALRYAALGYRVFPLAPGSKLPLEGGHGLLDASLDVEQIARWWNEHPSANIGLRTDGLIVIDVDGENNPWCLERDRMSDMLIAPTQVTGGRSGLQFFFRQPDGKAWRNTASALAPNVDTRANGGYCVVPPSEITGTGRTYRWVEDHALDRPPAELPVPGGWLLDALEALEVDGARPAHANGAAEREIPAGARNDTLTSLAGSLRRIGMEESAIAAALGEVNTCRCKPPLPAREVEKIARSVSRYEPDQAATSMAEGGTLIVNDDDDDEIPDPVDPGDFPEDLLNVPGLVGEIMKFNLETAIFPQPVLALGAALSLMATITGRKVQDDRGTQTNLYVVGLCPSGGGKEHARKVNKLALSLAGCEEMIGPESFGSSAGIISAIENQPTTLFQVDEIGRYLRTFNDAGNSHLYHIVSVLLKLFTSAGGLYIGDAYADLKRVKRIRWPHACIYATTPPDSFYGGLSHESLSDGFAARVLVFDAIRDRTNKQKGIIKDLPASITEQVASWRTFAPGGNLCDVNPQPVSLTYSTEAEDVFTTLEAVCVEEEQKAGPELGTIWTRCSEKARKLALLWMASAQGISARPVTFEAAQWAAGLCAYLTRRIVHAASRMVADTEIESKTNLMLRLICEAGRDGVTKKRLLWRFRSIPRRTRDEIVQTLVESGKVVLVPRRTGKPGRPAFSYVAKEHARIEDMVSA